MLPFSHQSRQRPLFTLLFFSFLFWPLFSESWPILLVGMVPIFYFWMRSDTSFFLPKFNASCFMFCCFFHPFFLVTQLTQCYWFVLAIILCTYWTMYMVSLLRQDCVKLSRKITRLSGNLSAPFHFLTLSLSILLILSFLYFTPEFCNILLISLYFFDSFVHFFRLSILY